MNNKKFKNLIEIVEFDIQVYVSGMIKSKNYYDNEVVELGAYVGASYTLFSKKEKIEMTEEDKLKLINHISEFYNRLIRPNGITKNHELLIRTKYFQLLNENPKIIQSYLEKIAEVALKQ